MPGRATHSTPAEIVHGRTWLWATLRVAARGAVLLLALTLAPSARTAATEPGAEPPVRIGFSRSMFRGVNENNARASLRTYAAALAHDAQFPADPNPILFDGASALTALLQEKAVDTISLTIDEFFSLEEGLLNGPLLISTVDDKFTEEYIVAVHRDSGIARVADLRGRRILLHDNMRCSLAPHWLKVLLATAGLESPATFFGHMTLAAKPALVVLPVFFRQADACVITHRGLEVLGELNPQITVQLRILATSPKVVPALTAFRRDFPPSQADRVATAVARSHLQPAGRQVMTLFQCDRVEVQPASLLDSSRELWAAYRRLHPAGTAAPTLAAAPRASEASR